MEKTYQFTLVLSNVNEETDNLEDSLFEAGCDDALINFRNNTVYLDFDRRAASLEQAVISAINDVESAPIGTRVIAIAPEDWVTESEVAMRLGINRQTVSLWIKGARRRSISFPKPVMKLAQKSPLWKWMEIVAWLYRNQILIKEKETVDNAVLLESLNAVLEERNEKTRKFRQSLLKKLTHKFKPQFG